MGCNHFFSFLNILFITVLATIIYATPKKTWADTRKQVQLLYCKTASKEGHIYAYGYVQTEGSNSKDSVIIHYQVANNEWKDVNAEYVGEKDGRYGLWYFEIDGGLDPMSGYSKASVDFKFAIKYINPSGETYWDNNFHSNYTLNVPETLNNPGLR